MQTAARTQTLKSCLSAVIRIMNIFSMRSNTEWEDYLLKPIKSGDILNCLEKYGSIWMKNMQCPRKQQESIMSRWLQL